MGLKHLNLSRTSMSPKGEHTEAQRCKLYSCSELYFMSICLLFLAGVNSLCQALCANPAVASTLTHLDLSGNSLRGDDLPVRATFPRSVISNVETN